MSISQVIGRTRPSVVRIEAETCEGESVGTGFITGGRLITTAYHVVDGASQIRIRTPGGSKADAQVVGYDRERDVALLRARSEFSGAPLRFANRGGVGSEVVALGFPLGLPFTATRGSVTGRNRNLDIEGVRVRGLLQTDAAVNPGNSGGPIINGEGEVVGVVVAGSTEYQGIGFGIPTRVVGPLVAAWSNAPNPVPVGADCGDLAEPEVPSPVAPPPPPDTGQVSLAEARRLVDASFTAIKAGDYPTAFDYATTAIPPLEAAGDPLLGNAYYNAGKALLEYGDCSGASQYLALSLGMGTPLQNAIREDDYARAVSCSTP